jgi:uncharacterized membrane protein YhiD involved in acid resistance
MKRSPQAEGLYVTASLFIAAGTWVEAGLGNALIAFGVAMLFGALWKSLFSYLDEGGRHEGA